MNKNSELIVMLTCNDRTVENACEIFEQCKNSKVNFWGFKQQGLPFEKMKELFSIMKKCGKAIALEVVAYTEEECIEGAKMAAACGCDLLLGTLFFDSVNEYCKNNKLKYMPFVGQVSGCPSVLEGSVDDMIAQAKRYLEQGVYGINLLGYRYTGDSVALNKRFISEVNAPVCLAGSINSFERLQEIKEASPWAFTIGMAFFENKFGGTFKEQLEKVCAYIDAPQTAASRVEVECYV